METKPLIAIVGPTASGKTALAVEMAKQFDGEIICADSRTVYKDMDIGTAKPTKEEQEAVPHWGLDLVRLDQKFTAAEFKEYTIRKIEEIRSRGHVPFIVGGTGLYIDAVLFDYQFGEPADEGLRRELEQLTVEELQARCRKNRISLPRNDKNKRHLIRAIEQKGVNNGRRVQPINNSIVIGIQADPEVLRKRIEHRADEIFESGIIYEAEQLAEKYGWDHESMTGNIYPLCREYLAGSITLEVAKNKFIVQDRRLAKRQLTWFRRNQYIDWLPIDEARTRIISLFASEH